MFERFTDPARQVVVFAQDEARGLKHDYIGTEHLLLGLLREEDGLAARVLEELDVTVEEVRAGIARIVGTGSEATAGQIPFTPRAKKVLELALREALGLGHNYIGTEHVLLGLLREEEGVAARILVELDAGAEKVRDEVLRKIGSSTGRRRRRFPVPPRALSPQARMYRELAEARAAALEAGDYDLARKLLELEIDARERAKAEPPADEPEAGAA